MELEHSHGLLYFVDAALGDELPEEDAARAEGYRGVRRQTFIAGRTALSRALQRLGAGRVSIPSDDRGAPIPPPGFVGSISHKGDRAVAIAALDEGFDIGVDLEFIRPVRDSLSEAILTPAERARVARDEDRELSTLASFSIKEAIYKAIDPSVRRYVGFHEAELVLPPIGPEFAKVIATMTMAHGEPAPVIEATIALVDGCIVATARALRTRW